MTFEKEVRIFSCQSNSLKLCVSWWMLCWGRTRHSLGGVPRFTLLCGVGGFLGKAVDLQGETKGLLKTNHLWTSCFALRAVGGRLLPAYKGHLVSVGVAYPAGWFVADVFKGK